MTPVPRFPAENPFEPKHVQNPTQSEVRPPEKWE
jgi:hypothetical protein